MSDKTTTDTGRLEFRDGQWSDFRASFEPPGPDDRSAGGLFICALCRARWDAAHDETGYCPGRRA